MEVTATGGFLRFFSTMADPRTGCNKFHKLQDMLVIAIMAVLCGADGWAEIAMFGQVRHQWLATFLELPHGIPSHDTFARVFSLLKPDEFERCFMAWMSALVEVSPGRLIAIDGKSLRRSFTRAWDKSGMVHMVSAFVNHKHNRVVFGQVAVEDKSNEITAIPKLLDLMDLKGAIVTIDSMGCQREIAKKIDDGGGEYFLCVKDNQPALRKKVQAMLDEAVLGGIEGLEVGYFEQTEEGHNRQETRRVWTIDDVSNLGKRLLGQWAGLEHGSLTLVERVRKVLGDPEDKTTVERHYYISNRPGCEAQTNAGYIRGHWSVENNLHWQLDMSFREDERRIRIGHGAENFSRLTRIALNLLKRDKSIKNGIKGKRLKAAWDPNYLLQLMGQ